DRAGYLARQRMGERPVLATGWEAELDGRSRADDRDGLCMLGNLPQFGRVEQVAPGLGQTFVIEHVPRRVDDRVLKDSRAPDPLSRILGCFRVQPGQEDQRADRAEDRLRAVAPVLLVELPDVLIAKHNAASSSSTYAQGFAEIMERDVSGLIQREQHWRAPFVVARLARDAR